MKFRIVIIVLFSVLANTAWTQTHFDFTGKVISAKTKEAIPFAKLLVVNLEIGQETDKNGVFHFYKNLPNFVELRVSATGYETKIVKVNTLEKQLVVELKKVHLEFDEVIVTFPSSRLQKENSFNVETLDLKKQSIASSNLSEVLAQTKGVQVASIGSGISKPVLRGMQGLRVLTLSNNVRLENQQWGGDHGMAVSELGVGKVEIIKGPSSLLFGNDAIGGVINLIDAPHSNLNSQQLSVGTSFESATMATQSTLGYRFSKGRFRIKADGLYANNADYRLPDGNFVKNSRFQQYGGKLGMSWNRDGWVSHLRYTYAYARNGIPGHTHDSIVEKDDFISSKQLRTNTIPAQLIHNHIASWENKWFLARNKFVLITSFTSNNLKELEDKHTVPGLGMQLLSGGINLRHSIDFNKKWTLSTGFQSNFQSNRNLKIAEEQLIDDFNQLDNGLFALGSFKKDKWNVQLGARLDARNLIVNAQQFEKQFLNPTFSLGMAYAGVKHVFRANASSGFRAPHVSELFSDGVHHGSLRYEKGARNLRPEESIQLDASYEFRGEHLRWVINPFYSYLQNYITLNPEDSIIDGMKLYSYVQFPNAQLYGVDAGFHYHPHFAHILHWESTFSYVRGESFTGTSFALIPQAKLSTSIQLDFSNDKKFHIENITLQHHYYFPQNKTAQWERSSVDFHLLNLGMNMKLTTKKSDLKFSIGVKNLLNTKYMHHLSRLKDFYVENTGLNAYFKIKYIFNHKIKSKSK